MERRQKKNVLVLLGRAACVQGSPPPSHRHAWLPLALFTGGSLTGWYGPVNLGGLPFPVEDSHFYNSNLSCFKPAISLDPLKQLHFIYINVTALRFIPHWLSGWTLLPVTFLPESGVKRGFPAILLALVSRSQTTDFLTVSHACLCLLLNIKQTLKPHRLFHHPQVA